MPAAAMTPATLDANRQEIALLVLDQLLARDLGCVDDLPATVRGRAEAAVHAAMACADDLLGGCGGSGPRNPETIEQGQ